MAPLKARQARESAPSRIEIEIDGEQASVTVAGGAVMYEVSADMGELLEPNAGTRRRVRRVDAESISSESGPLSQLREFSRLIHEYENVATRASQVYPGDVDAAEALRRSLQSVVAIEIGRCRRELRRRFSHLGPSLSVPSHLSHLYADDECGLCGTVVATVYVQSVLAGMTGFLLDPCSHMAWLPGTELVSLWLTEQAEVMKTQAATRVQQTKSAISNEADDASRRASGRERFTRLRAGAKERGGIRWGDCNEVYADSSGLVEVRNSLFMTAGGTGSVRRG